jgi:hypothetical protein
MKAHVEAMGSVLVAAALAVGLLLMTGWAAGLELSKQDGATLLVLVGVVAIVRTGNVKGAR